MGSVTMKNGKEDESPLGGSKTISFELRGKLLELPAACEFTDRLMEPNALPTAVNCGEGNRYRRAVWTLPKVFSILESRGKGR